jgi:hypothetical protein
MSWPGPPEVQGGVPLLLLTATRRRGAGSAVMTRRVRQTPHGSASSRSLWSSPTIAGSIRMKRTPLQAVCFDQRQREPQQLYVRCAVNATSKGHVRRVQACVLLTLRFRARSVGKASDLLQQTIRPGRLLLTASHHLLLEGLPRRTRPLGKLVLLPEHHQLQVGPN